MRFIAPALLIFLFTFFVSCENTAQTGMNMTPEQFEKAMEGKAVQVLDVRTAGEYRSGHLENALQADWINMEQFMDRTKHLDKNKPVFVYCLSGSRSVDAAAYLQQQGFKEVYHLKGGVSAWRKTGRKLVAEDASKAQTPKTEYDAITASASLVLIDFGAEWCPPCKKMEPVLVDFMKEQGDKVKLVKMDGGNETALMQSMKIDALPTFILYNNGRETQRKQGVMTKEELTGWIK